MPVRTIHLCAAGAVAAGFFTASPALGLAGDGGPAGSQPPAADELPVFKLNPTRRNIEIEVPLKADGALLGNVALKITPEDKLFADAKLLKTYLGKIVKPEVLNRRSCRARARRPASCGRHNAGGQEDARCGKLVRAAPGVAAAGRACAGAAWTGAALLSAAGYHQAARHRYPLRSPSHRVAGRACDGAARTPKTSASKTRRDIASDALERPADVSGYLNMRATAAYVSQSSSGSTGLDVTTVDLEGAVEVQGRGARKRGLALCRRACRPDPGLLPGLCLLPARNAARLRPSRGGHPDPLRRYRAGHYRLPERAGPFRRVRPAILRPASARQEHPADGLAFLQRRAPVERGHRHRQRPVPAHQARPRKLQSFRYPAAGRRERCEAGHRGRYRRAPDPGVQGLFGRRAARARHRRVVFQRRRQILRSGRCSAGRRPWQWGFRQT